MESQEEPSDLEVAFAALEAAAISAFNLGLRGEEYEQSVRPARMLVERIAGRQAAQRIADIRAETPTAEDVEWAKDAFK